MKLRINKACDLSSISVLPPQVRKSNAVPPGMQASHVRSQQSQQSFSQSQPGLFSQLSQNSLDEVLTNEQRFGSQERENSIRRISCLAPISQPREENHIPVSKSCTSIVRKWGSASVPDHRCQLREEVEHKIGMMETSINRFAMILDSVQNDVIHVKKGIKEISMEMECMRQKLIACDDSVQQISKGQEEFKASLDRGFKAISDQLSKDVYGDKLHENLTVLLALPEHIEAHLLKIKNDLCDTFAKEMQEMACSFKTPDKRYPVADVISPKDSGCHIISPEKQLLLQNPCSSPPLPSKVCTQASAVPKIEMRTWNSIKLEQATMTQRRDFNKDNRQKGVSRIEQEKKWRVIVDSDEEIDKGFSCLLKSRDTEMGNYIIDEANEETAQILRRARRRKRKQCNTIIIN